MKGIWRKFAAIMAIVLIAALICTGIELKNTREELMEVMARNKLLEIEVTMKTADNIRLDVELAQAKATGSEVQAEVQ